MGKLTAEIHSFVKAQPAKGPRAELAIQKFEQVGEDPDLMKDAVDGIINVNRDR